MSTMTVSQLAKRTGLTASALRDDESLGLVQAQRLDDGYRSHDDAEPQVVAPPEGRALLDDLLGGCSGKSGA